MKAFVEFGHKTSYTKSFSNAEFKNWFKVVSYGAFSFHWTILSEGFDRKSRENVQKTLFRGSSYKMAKVKDYFWLIYTLSIVIQK